MQHTFWKTIRFQDYSLYRARTHEQIKRNFDMKLYSSGVFFDLEKAFDTVNHKILIKKLEHYGIKGSYNNWLRFYLSNRKQSIMVGSTKSFEGSITCGVPQGSVLGSLLFLHLYQWHENSSQKFNCTSFCRRHQPPWFRQKFESFKEKNK